LLELVLEMGNRWSSIAKVLKTRTEHAVKNRYRSLIKRYCRAAPSKQKSNKWSEKDLILVRRILEKLNSQECKREGASRSEADSTSQNHQETAKGAEPKGQERERDDL